VISVGRKNGSVGIGRGPDRSALASVGTILAIFSLEMHHAGSIFVALSCLLRRRLTHKYEKSFLRLPSLAWVLLVYLAV
jgi:Lon protease-like protein